MPLGAMGLNLRDEPGIVGLQGFVDVLNWRLDERGAPVRRLGYQSYVDPNSSVNGPPSAPLELYVFSATGITTTILAYCVNGKVYSSPGDGTWTLIAAGLSTTARPRFATLGDVVYWCNGTDVLLAWDGTTITTPGGTNDVQTLTITGTPTGGTFTITYAGQTTGAIAYNASAATVQAALVALSNVGTGQVLCAGGALPGTGVTITFRGTLGGQSQSVVTTSDSFTGGTAPASHVAHTTTGATAAPKGAYIAVWRNRLWISGDPSHVHRTYWSDIGATWVNVASNYVDIHGPHGDAITALGTSPASATFDGLDGILVYTKRSTHRIIDDSDNIAGVIAGGSNVLVDSATGCVNQRTVVSLNGAIYSVGLNGIYATDGHHPLVLQSAKLGRFFSTLANQSQRLNMTAVAWQGSYLLSLTRSGDAVNSLTLELYTLLPADPGDRQHPITAQTIPAQAWAYYPSTLGDQLYFSDASAGNTLFVRQYATGGWDTTGVSTRVPITATGRTGATTFGMPHPKRVRRVTLAGHGQVTVGVAGDFETGIGESQPFTMNTGSTCFGSGVWGSGAWGVGAWGGAGGVSVQTQWFTKRARYHTLTLLSIGSNTSTSRGALGVGGQAIGGASVYSAIVDVTPLAADT